MLRKLVKPGASLSILWPFSGFFDADDLTKKTETEKKVDLTVVKLETGWDRLHRMFQIDDFGEFSKEIVTIMHIGGMSLFVGAVYGGFINTRTTYMNFVRNNQATAFSDHLEAKKRLQDAMTKSFGRGAFKWAWRLSLFCTTFMGVTTTISVYRGKSGVLEYVAAGLISGSLYKFNMGPRGWIVGGGLGSVLGLIAGVTTMGLLSLTGLSMDEVRYWQYQWRQDRENRFKKGFGDYLAKEQSEELRYHESRVSEIGNTIDQVK